MTDVATIDKRASNGISVDGVIHFASSSPSEYAEAVRTHYLPARFAAMRGASAFHASVTGRTVDDITLTTVSARPHVIRRTSRDIQDGPDGVVKLCLILSGSGSVKQADRELQFTADDMFIFDPLVPYSMTFSEDFRIAYVMFPRMRIGLSDEQLGVLSGVPFSEGVGLQHAVRPFFSELGAAVESLSGRSGTRLMHNAVELVGTLAIAALESFEQAVAASPRPRLIDSVKQAIEFHLTDPDLNPGRIGQLVHVSTRHIHNLFRREGVTVSDWVRRQRLYHCRADLLNPQYDSWAVAAIGARWGFDEPSHFSRAFRAEYGMPPARFRDLRCADGKTLNLALRSR